MRVFCALAFLFVTSGGAASATTTTVPSLDLHCVQAGVAAVRVIGTLQLAPKTQRTHTLSGTLEIDIMRVGLSGNQKVLAERVLVSGEYSRTENEATAASLSNEAIALLHFAFARGMTSFIEYEGIRYPTLCEMKPR